MSIFLATRKRHVKQKQQTKQEGGILAFGKEFLRRFQEDECPMRAASLAFTSVFSLIPLLLLALAALGFFAPEPGQATEKMVQALAQLAPGREAEKAIRDILQQVHLEDAIRELTQKSFWAFLIGVITQIWAGISLFLSISVPLNIAWDVQETRGFLKLRLIGLSVFGGTALLFLLSLLPTAGPDFVRNLHIPWLGLPAKVPFWVQAFFALIALGIDVALFTLIYLVLPNRKVPWRVALAGGVTVGILFELFKKGFAIYLSRFGNYNKLYGAFGGITLMVSWIWYSCIVIIVGAILCKMFDERWSGEEEVREK